MCGASNAERAETWPAPGPSAKSQRVRLDRSLLALLPALSFGCAEAAPTSDALEPENVPKEVASSQVTKPEAKSKSPARAKAARSTAAERSFPAAPLNVIWLTVDSLRADMPWTGYSRDIAPNLTKLAAESVVFENHRATTSLTAQSVPTMLTGRLASTLYRSGYFFAGYNAENEFFPELLQRQGIRTLGLHAHLYFDRGKGLNQGFDVWQMVDGLSFNERTDTHVTSPKTTEKFIALLKQPENTSRQFFAWTHYMDPHDGYVAHEDSPNYGSSLRDRYDNEVHFTDRWLGSFLTWAQEQPWWKRTAVIVTADHGEAFGEHGRNYHAHELWDHLTRVPLIVHAPGLTPRRVSSAHSHVDLAPTVLELMGQPASDRHHGRSLVPALRGEVLPPRDVVLELAADNVQPPRRALVSGHHKIIRFGERAGAPEKVFDLRADPLEKHDLSRSDPELAERLSARLDIAFGQLPVVDPYGGMKLKNGRAANGPMRPTVASRD